MTFSLSFVSNVLTCAGVENCLQTGSQQGNSCYLPSLLGAHEGHVQRGITLCQEISARGRTLHQYDSTAVLKSINRSLHKTGVLIFTLQDGLFQAF